ncbi:hypothetical protein BH11PSE12_BH11PSE12_16350 [soil metagenome]
MHEFRFYGNRAVQLLLRTPLPRLLIACIAVALLITLIPLVLSLFVVFLLLKLLLLVVVLAVRKGRQHPSELDYSRRPFQRKSREN